MSSTPDLAVLEAAATWYVQLNDGTRDDARTLAWQAWLRASPQHAAAWARVELLQQQWAQVSPKAALSGLSAAQAQRRDVLKVLGMLVAVGGTWLASEQVPYRAMLAQQRTGSGERRALHLEDGSQLHLNVNSAVDIHFDGQQRRVQLLRGEIMIQTAKDPAQRPFIVHTEDGSVRALGTRFCVRQLDGRTRVGVLEDAVELRPLDYPERVSRLNAGQQASFDFAQVSAVTALPSGASAWTQGMLSVNDWRLGDFIEELERYRPGVLRCAAAVSGLSISGAFRVDDTDTILENLGRTLPVQVRYLTRYWVSIEAV
ncbi:FecR domain-containing protein [Pseudomonas sp. Marseille-P9899]|uniref:FecR domain-containing protein n=1 Tax=Pseudomonas sp. Marseille-P9899 TaxID=2730401 RepID=UPI00158EC64E|nr:FecR domain-containing protein [Pseudomonas sp. Marseille-P9899]